MASANNLVYELETLQEQDDGTVIDRHYDVDWNQLGFEGEKSFRGATLHFAKNSISRVAISVANDFRGTFKYRKVFDLRGTVASGDEVAVRYRIDPGLKGEFFKMRIQFYHDDGVQVEMVPPIQIHFEPLSTNVNPRSDSESAEAT